MLDWEISGYATKYNVIVTPNLIKLHFHVSKIFPFSYFFSVSMSEVVLLGRVADRVEGVFSANSHVASDSCSAVSSVFYFYLKDSAFCTLMSS